MGWNKCDSKVETTIVINNYNYAQFIDECIQSCIATKPDEIIIVDDASTDDSLSIIKKYTDKYDYIRGLSLIQNYGARERPLNTGIVVAKGKYIVPMDADDILYPEYFKKVLPAFTDDKVGVVCIECRRFGDEDGTMLRSERPWGADKVKSLLEGNKVFGPSCFRKEAWRSVGGYTENEYFKVALGDWDFWLKIAVAGWKFVDVLGFLCGYRVHKASGTFQRDFSPAINHLKNKYRDLIKEKNITEGFLA
jgi:glycosyltransferase involved in cell wall biosynthesis